MAIKPELNIAVAGEDIASNEYNENFNKLLEYIEDVSDELILKVNTINSQISTSVMNSLQSAYPVGAIYIGVSDECPMASLFGTWEKVSEGKVLQGSDSSHEVGTTIEAGLPNITGSFRAEAQGNGSPSGSFTASRTVNNVHSGNGGAQENKYTFNASRSSSIYKDDCNTVQPPAYVVNIWKRTA